MRRFRNNRRNRSKRKKCKTLGESWDLESDYVPSSDFDFSSGVDSESDSEKRQARMVERALDGLDMSVDSDFDSGGDDEFVAPPIVKKEVKKKNRKRPRKDKESLLVWEALEDEIDSWIAEHEMDNDDLDASEGAVAETAEQPPEITGHLLRFQREWLAWALKQEASEIRGGILADEMGMGKTIQAISLVLAARALHSSNSALDESTPTTSIALPKMKATLIICPLVAVIQWKNEIVKFTKDGSAKVLVYHGPKRSTCPEKFGEYDFVLTTYSILEADYRKYNMAPKDRCQWCGKSFLPQKMSLHQKYFCGPNAVRTLKQSKQVRKKKPMTKYAGEGTKTSAVEKDENDDMEDVKRKAAVKISNRGRQRKKANSSPHNEKSVVTDNGSSCTGKSILHSVVWERVILDEAHYAKDRRCNTAKAVLSLESKYRWALSGTPLQNRVGELYSLIRFLQIFPYSYYFCKDCDCKCLDYSATCSSCPHTANRHFCWWNKYIARPIQAWAHRDEGRRAMILLRRKLLKSVLLRRTKTGRAADLALPPRFVFLRRDVFDNKEEDYYNALYNQSQAQFNTYVTSETIMNNYAHIFDLLTRLRQALDHPYLVVYSGSESVPNGHKASSVEGCGICHEAAEDPLVTSCEHVFCKACLLDYSSALGQVPCPLCLKPLTVDFTTKKNNDDQIATVKGFKRSSILNKINLLDFQTSTKIEALREEIRFMIERDGSAKGIVFSQYTSFLDLIKYSLQKSGLQCVQLVGSMSITARDEAIQKFTDDPECKIFLMSLKAGGVALNLTVASHVFLMDPWWNPAAERQAQDRIHRIGQYKPIRIVRFIIENTIEERILKLQEKKDLVFEGTVGGSSGALEKLSAADLRFLFNS